MSRFVVGFVGCRVDNPVRNEASLRESPEHFIELVGVRFITGMHENLQFVLQRFFRDPAGEPQPGIVSVRA